MKRKLIAVAMACALGLGAAAPVAQADDHRRNGYYGHDRYDNDRRRGRRDHGNDDDGEAVAAGVIGLVLGLAIASAASQPRDRRAQCRDNYQRCGPPPGYYDQGYPQQGYQQQGYQQQGYYDDRRSAYESDYGYAPQQPPQGYERPACTRRERQWDRYANQYVVVDVPC